MMVYILICEMCEDTEDYDLNDVISDTVGVFSSKEEAYKHFPIDKCSIVSRKNSYEVWAANVELIREFNDLRSWGEIAENTGFIHFRIEQCELNKPMKEWYN